MPPEPLPWDRIRDNKKHDRSDTLRSVARWRDSHHPSFNTRDHRWADDFRRPPQGYAKQGGYQLFPEDGFMPFRPSSTDRMVSDDTAFRSGYGKYARRPSFSHKGPYLWDSTQDTSSSSSFARQHHDVTTQRSVSDLITYSSHPPTDNIANYHAKHPTVDLLATAHRYDREQSLGPIDWKPIKWNRSSSLSSRGSGFSHTSSSRSMGADSDETKPEFPSAPAQSPSGEALASRGASGSYEETCPRKKQRLGWGQGLAKYEKQKVEGSDETFCKNTLIPCSTNAKSSQTIPSCLSEKSPRLSGPSECASPVTTSSVACSSSPGIDDKPPSMTENNDIGTCNLSDSPAHGFQRCFDEFCASLGHLNSANNLSDLLNDVLQIEDASSGDSNFGKSTAMHKILRVKSEVSKALEKTECEIDMFENELKKLNTEFETDGSQVECSKFRENVDTSVPVQLVPSSGMHVEIPNFYNLEEVDEEVKDVDIDSPGTATSKFVGPLCIEKTGSTFGMGNCFGLPDAVEATSDSSEQPCIFLSSVTKEKTTVVSSDSKFEGSIDVCRLSDLRSGYNLNDVILVSNKNSAREAFELFSKLLPAGRSEDIWKSCDIPCQKTNSHVREKLASRKNSQRFKERALTLKFKALHHLWKEDTRLLSAKKYKAKSQKRAELNPRPSHIVHQKHRSSIRSRLNSPAGGLALAPTSEIVDLTSKLLSDTQIKVCRDNLKMPCLVDENEKRMLRFVSSNGLVEDPCAAEMERVMVNPWMANEKEIFLEKLATFGKDFKKIASFLDHKTTADCVEFYYKNHKSSSFEKIKKKSELKNQERAGFPYMMTSGNKWNREVNTASLVLLGEASVIAADADCVSKSEHTSRPSLGGTNYHWEDDISIDSLDAGVEDEREATAADMLAGLSSEAMSSCVTSCVEPAESGQFQKSVKPTDDDDDDDEETCSDESSGELDSVDWTDEEKLNFIDAVRCYGKDFVKIARRVRSRSRDQCKVFYSKARKSLGLDVPVLNVGKGTTLSDASGGGSDTEDTFVFETESVICSTQSLSKLDSCQASAPAASTSKQLHPDELGESIEMMEQSTDEDYVPERCGESTLNAARVSSFLCEEEAEAVDLAMCSAAEEAVVRREQTSKCNVDLSGESQIMLLEGVEDENSSLGYATNHVNQPDKDDVDLGQGLCSLGLEESKIEENGSSSQIPRSYPQINKKEAEECRQRVGDVKLFGQILSQQQEVTSASLQHRAKPSSNMYDLNSSSSSRPPVLLNDFPARSYGFWDGSRIQTGFSSLPDPSILLAKYPPPAAAAAAAAAAGASFSSRVDERSLSCMSSVYPLLGPTPSSSSGNSSLMVPDYHHVQVYRGSQQLRHEGLLFPDIQQQQQHQQMTGRLEVVSSYQQSRAVGISDPVAAIKMHYATATMENDPWRGVADLER